jgi:Uma2 family endonuclease
VATVEQLAAMPRRNERCELVRGQLRMMSPAGGRHGRIAMRIGSLLDVHVRHHRLGVVYAAETGFVLSRNPDTVRAPDVAFVQASRWEQLEDDAGFLPFAPDLAVEVISPTDTFSEVEEKAFDWLDGGARLVVIIDPAARRVHAYRAADEIVVLGEEGVLDASDVVSGWRLRLQDLFKREIAGA